MECPKLDHVLVPLDGSELSERALPVAAELARRLPARIDLLTVPHSPSGSLAMVPDADVIRAGLPSQESLDDLVSEARSRAADLLSRHVSALRAEGLDAEPRLSERAPARAIVETAGIIDNSLIVMATHGRSGFDRWIFGSVAEKVLHATTRPLLLIPARAEKTPPHVERIILGLDGSNIAERALGEVCRLAKANEARVVLVHVAPDFGEMVRMGTDSLVQIEQHYEGWAERYLDRIAQRLGEEGVKADSRLLTDSQVVDSLLAEAARVDASLLAVCTHGHGGIGSWPIGSVSGRIARATSLPLLVVRADA